MIDSALPQKKMQKYNSKMDFFAFNLENFEKMQVEQIRNPLFHDFDFVINFLSWKKICKKEKSKKNKLKIK